MQMQNRVAVLLCNTRPAKMRGVASNAMIMCASSSDKVEVLDPPSGAVPGERVTFQGFPGMVAWLLYLQIQISHQHIYSHCPVIAKQTDYGNVGKKKVSFCWFEHKKENLKNISGDKKCDTIQSSVLPSLWLKHTFGWTVKAECKPGWSLVAEWGANPCSQFLQSFGKLSQVTGGRMEVWLFCVTYARSASGPINPAFVMDEWRTEEILLSD